MSILGGIGDAIGGVLKCVIPVVDEVVGQLGQLQSTLEDMVRAPIQSMIDEVTGGIWSGSGAQAFMGECSNAFLPSAQSVTDGIGVITGNITAAVDALQQADAKAAGLVNDLTAEFENIYKS